MKLNIFLTIVLFFIISITKNAYTQFDILEKVKEKVEKKAEEKTDEAIDKVLNPEENQQQEKKPEESMENNETKETPVEKTKKDDLKSTSKYDFIPGDKVIYYEDFTQCNIGDFPSNWWTNMSGEVKTISLAPGNWFQMNSYGQFMFEKPFDFGENFTVEFDVVPYASENSGSAGFDISILSIIDGEPYPTMYVPGKGGIAIDLNTPNGQNAYSCYADGNYTINSTYTEESGLLKRNEVNHISIWVQKSRVRLYLHGQKLFDIPKALATGLKCNQIRFWMNNESYPLFSNIRIAEAGADMRNKLLTEGKLVVHGINFDINSDKIKPTSAPVLKEISSVLKDNPKLKLKIVGHTDSDGDDKANLELSKKRALSVKNSLVNDFGIEATRLETDGKGESQPMDKNNTPQGKANNRRVEFIKF